MVRRTGFVCAVVGLLALLAALAAQATLVAYYDFEDGSGTSVTDVTGNGHAGTIQNSDGTEWVAGYIGTYALELSGSQCVTTLNSTASQLGIGGNDPRSIGAWANITTFNNGGLFDLGSTGSAGQEFCLRTTTNANQFRA